MPRTYLGHTLTQAHADLDALWALANTAEGDAQQGIADAAAAAAVAAAASATAASAVVAVQTYYYPTLPGEVGVTTNKYPVGNILRYGAVPSGLAADAAANDTAIDRAIAAIPDYGTIEIPAGAAPYIVDAEHKISKPCILRGTGGKLKLKDQSNVFNDFSNPYGRYIFHIRASHVKVTGLVFDGNSPNNYQTIAGINYYLLSAGGNVRNANFMIVGFYGADVSGGNPLPVDIEDVEITGNSIYDVAGTCIDSTQQGFTKVIKGLRVENNFFKYGQGVQVAFSSCVNSICSGNTFLNAYFAAFQYYYACLNCNFTGNAVYLAYADINMALVNPTLKTGALLNYFGEVLLGKIDANPNISCHATNNRLYGARMYMQNGMRLSTMADNVSYGSIGTAFEYDDGGGNNYGNSIERNRAYASDQPGLYIGTVTSAAVALLVLDNQFFGCCTKTLSPSYGGRVLDAGIFCFSEYVVFRRNLGRKIGAAPKYGFVMDATHPEFSDFRDNDFRGAGATADIIQNIPGSFPPTPVVATRAYLNYDLQAWDYYSDAFVNDNTLDNLPGVTSGMALITCGVESGLYNLETAGGVLTITVIVGSANAVATDTPGKLCLYAAALVPTFRNRLGATHPVSIKMFYR